MKCSGGVTAAAIILLLAGAPLLLLAVYALVRGVDYEGAVAVGYIALPGAWGTATGIGLLRLQRWALVSAQTITLLMIVGCVVYTLLAFIPPPYRPPEPEFSKRLLTALISGGIIKAVIFAVAVWWSTLFTRKRVLQQFADSRSPLNW
jgi:hypothetical protein